MIDESPFPRRVNGDPVEAPPGLVPPRSVLIGPDIRLEPLDSARHAGVLHRAGHAIAACLDPGNFDAAGRRRRSLSAMTAALV